MFARIRRFLTGRSSSHAGPGDPGGEPRGDLGALELFKTLSPFTRPYLPALALAGLLVLVGTGTKLLRPWPLKFLFDEILIPGAAPRPVQSLLLGIAGAIVAIALLDGGLGFLRQYLLKVVGQKVAFRMRVAIYGQIQRLSLTFHDRHQTGDLITRVITDVDKVQDLITEDLVEAGTSVLTLGGMLAVMFWLDWQLSLAMVVLSPLHFFALARYRRRLKQAERHVRRKEGEITSLAQETISSIRVVKAYGREEFERDRFEAHTGEALDANLRVSRTEAAFGALLDGLTAFSLAVLVWLGAQRVLSGGLTPGDLLIFIAYLRDFYGPTRTLSRLVGKVSRTSVRAGKITEVLRAEPAVRDLPGARPAPPLRGQIRFDNVCFAYVPDRPTLSEVHFQVEPGQVLALVGATGAGKSTIAALIARLYDPSAGRILLDGQDIRTYQLATLQPQISFVLQNSVLFRASVRENIAYGRPEATFEDIVAAAKAANAHEFIRALPDGYETVIGERGETLSGGQRQLIAIARALIRNAPILLLDEPTTGLDAKSEQLVLDALERLMAGRTTVVIAHKLSTVRKADAILVIENGRVVERGTHPGLLTLGGHYAELYQLQVPAERTALSAPTTIDSL
jgi:ATP-binding cassette subfamily B protein